jgi:hypothetical protein
MCGHVCTCAQISPTSTSRICAPAPYSSLSKAAKIAVIMHEWRAITAMIETPSAACDLSAGDCPLPNWHASR